MLRPNVVRAGAFLLASATALASAQTVPVSVPSVVRRASVAYAVEMRGLIGMQRHFTTQLQGGPFDHSEQSDSGQIFQNGRFVQLAYYRVVRDGQPFSTSQIAHRNDVANTDWAAGKIFFKEPYDPRYIGDYTFEPDQGACSSCATGAEAVRFTSAVQDEQHGDGVMEIDPATGHVLRLTYTPNVLPSHATSGTVREIGSQVLPDLWCVTRITQVYKGREFVFSGTGTFTGTFDHFRRLPSRSAAETALRNQTI